MSKEMDFCHSQEIYLINMEKKLLNMETGLNGATFKKVVHKKAEAKGELIGNKISKKSETKGCT